MYFIKSIPSYPIEIHRFCTKWTPIKKLMFSSLMAALAAILQAAGGLVPGIGFFISPFTTAPILLVTLISIRTGTLTYLLTILLLLLIEPSELMIFPFTTGLLGLGLGLTFRVFNQRLAILLTNGCLLMIGICIPLYGLGFPVIGPTFSLSFNMPVTLMILSFSIVYSWIWVEFGFYFLRKINGILRVV